MADRSGYAEAFEWQMGIWDRLSETYLHEIDRRFSPIVEALLERAELRAGDHVLDLGTGTGSVALGAADRVGPNGKVVGLDISPQMLAKARGRVAARSLDFVEMLEGPAEEIPFGDDSFDRILCSLSLMYVLDRGQAAREIGRVLRPGGRLVAAVWGAAEECDIVLFQQTAGKYSGPPPAPGVGPGALADATPFLEQLAEAGLEARVESEVLSFDFPDFGSAWAALAGVTTAHLAPELQEKARDEVTELMYPDGDGPRRFRNLTQFIVARAS